MRFFRGLLRPVGGDDEKPRAAATSCQGRKQIHGRIVRRVEVFENEDQGSSCREPPPTHSQNSRTMRGRADPATCCWRARPFPVRARPATAPPRSVRWRRVPAPGYRRAGSAPGESAPRAPGRTARRRHSLRYIVRSTTARAVDGSGEFVEERRLTDSRLAHNKHELRSALRC